MVYISVAQLLCTNQGTFPASSHSLCLSTPSSYFQCELSLARKSVLYSTIMSIRQRLGCHMNTTNVFVLHEEQKLENRLYSKIMSFSFMKI